MVSNCFYLHFISQIITVGKIIFTCFLASLVTQLVKNGPEMPATWVQSLGWEDPLEEGMATHSSILAWGIPRTEEPGGLQSMGSHSVRHD